MKLPEPLVPGKFIKRYKRFFVDVKLPSGEIVTAHCPNTGALTTCLEEGWDVLLSESNNPKRKLKYTLELSHNHESWIGVNTQKANGLVKEYLLNEGGWLIAGYDLSTEPKWDAGTRFDIKLENDHGETTYIEVKSVTMRDGKKAVFPDAVTTRGQKHLEKLIEVKKQGFGAALFFVVQREDVSSFSPASWIDETYAKLLKKASDEGVEIRAFQVSVNPPKIAIEKEIEIIL